ncbi:MAG: FAD-dependent oxidoreductase [Nitrososphaerota archaeon]|nr:FAD-dependent oxidoreductase [Nitrososphaerota archaeon]
MYDIVIVGGGPAGIFCALSFIENNKDLSIIVLEKGHDITNRYCPARRLNKLCVRCDVCNIYSGLGGAGAFSDGKITLDPEIGGWLPQVISIEKSRHYIKKVDEVFLKYGAPEEVYGNDSDIFEKWRKKASLAGMKLQKNPVRHMGSDLSFNILNRIKNELKKSVEIRVMTEVESFIVENNVVKGVKTKDGESFSSRFVVAAPGRSGAGWLRREFTRLHITMKRNPIDLGVRVEVPAEVMEEITRDLYEPKLRYVSKRFDDNVRTFCVNPHGEVLTEFFENVVTVNGHSYNSHKTENTNFAILVSTDFTEPFKEPIEYGLSIAKLANLISNGVVIQRLGDLIQGRRSTYDRISKSIVSPTLPDATPGDLSFILPYRILSNIVEMLKAMDKLIPGIYSKQDTLLYGVEAKFYSSRVEVNNYCETSVKNLFAIGDGAGITRGLSQAAASGLYVGQVISERLKN